MENEENTNEENAMKESGNTKPKEGVQNILAIFIFIAVVLTILLIIFLDKSSNSLGGMVFVVATVAVAIFGVVVISMVGIGKSSSEYLKNKNQSTFLEKKRLKRWLIFDISFFLVFPICVGIYLWIMGMSFISGSMFILVFIISLASGSKVLVKNKNSSILSRISGWFLVIFSIMVLVIYLFNIFHK